MIKKCWQEFILDIFEWNKENVGYFLAMKLKIITVRLYF